MKKSIFLLILISFSFACSNDESIATEQSTFQEKIVGTWQLIDRVPHGIEKCELSNLLRFSKNGKFYIEMYTSDGNGGCESASNHGTWGYLGDNQIDIQLDGVDGSSYFKITFSEDAKFLQLVDDPGQGGKDVVTETYARQ